MLSERTRVREIVGVQDDLTLTWHWHQVEITEILRDGAVISATYSPARALDVADISDVIDPVLIDLANQCEAATTLKNAAEAALETAKSDRDAALASAAEIAVARDAAVDQLETKSSALAEALGQIGELQAQLAALTAPIG